MRILFFTLIKITSIDDRGIYADMIREFVKRGHKIEYYFPLNKFIKFKGNNYSLNSIFVNQKIQKTKNFFIKYLLYLLLDLKFSKIINKLQDSFDMLILVTPSIFQEKIIKAFRLKFPNKKIILLLKDIFPDNALELGVLNTKFPKVLIYNYFKKIELKIYLLVDKIGLTTELDKIYFLSKYPNLSNKLFISPNSMEFYNIKKTKSRKDLFLPSNKRIIIYSGNIGIPQDPIFFHKLICLMPKKYYFVLIGEGTSYRKFINIPKTKVMVINKHLDHDILDQYLINSDFGLVVLSNKFKSNNFPAKTLVYINANLKILAFTNQFNSLKTYIQNGTIIGKWFESSLNNLNNNFIISNIKDTKITNKSNKEFFSVATQVSDIINLNRSSNLE